MSKEPSRADLQKQIEKLTVDNTALRRSIAAHEAAAKTAQKIESMKDAAIDALRDDLMAKSVELARMEGYIIRANEGDPQPPLPLRRAFGTTLPYENNGADYAYGTERRKEWWNR